MRALVTFLLLLIFLGSAAQNRTHITKSLKEINDKCLTIQGADQNSMTVADLVEYILGPDIPFDNVSYQGVLGDAYEASLGRFYNGSCVPFDFEEGIIISSGRVGNAVGPNSSSVTGDSLSLSGDQDLNTLIPDLVTVDASWIQFKLVSDKNLLIEIQYVFASDEYNHYVYNPPYSTPPIDDLFGIFVNGQNFALIPGTTLPVSINTVNNGFAGTGELASGPCTNCEFFLDNADLSIPNYNIESNGLTTLLSSRISITAGQQYTIKIAIADGHDNVGDSWAFLKSNIIFPPDVLTNDAVDITSRSALVGGKIIYPEDGIVEQQGIFWSDSPNPVASGIRVPLISDLGDFSYPLEGLEPNTQYYFVAYATNAAGTVYGEEKTFTTLAEPPVVETLVPSGITPFSAVLGGEVIYDGGALVNQRGIYLGTTPLPFEEGVQIPMESETGVFQTTLEDLQPNAQYYVVAYARNIADTAFGEVMAFTTLIDLPGVVTGEADNIEVFSATIHGEANWDGGDFIYERGFFWGENSDPVIYGNQIEVGNSTGVFSKNLDALVPGGKYFYVAYAINGRDIGYGEVKSFTTETVIVRIPNAFRPLSSKENNKTFKPYFNITPIDYSLVVFNNWGAEIFNSQDHETGWDGTFNSSDVPAGGYVFRLSYTDYQGKKHETNGIVMLIR